MTESTLTPSGSSASAALAAWPPSCASGEPVGQVAGQRAHAAVRSQEGRTWDAVRLLRLPPKAPKAVRFAAAM